MNSRSVLSDLIPPRVRDFHALHNLFATYLGQGCFFVPAGRPSRWIILAYPRRDPQPHYFAHPYGKRALRDGYLTEHFRRAGNQRRTLVGRFAGFLDFFTPVRRGRKNVGVLFSGPFLDRVPDARDLRERWRLITGTEAGEQHDFRRYVRACLEVPVLDAVALRGCEDLMGIWARWFAGEDSPSFAVEADRLRREVFAPRMPHPYWVDWVVGTDKFHARTEEEGELARWEREELGLTRYPTVAAALMPRDVGTDPVESLCRSRRLQWEAYAAARKRPETVAGPLGDYGVTVLISPRPEAKGGRTRLEIRDRILGLLRDLERRTGFPVLAGVGSTGGDLPRSFREAVAALHLAVRTGENPKFADASLSGEGRSPASALLSASRNLADALLGSSAARLASVRDALVRAALLSGERAVVAVRAGLLGTAGILLERLRWGSGGALQEDVLDGAWEMVAARLEAADSLPDLLATFSGIVDDLRRLRDRPREARQAAQVETVVREMEREPERDWALAEQCRRAGLSAPTFLKRFRALTGEGYRERLRRLRLEKSRELLREGALSLERVAQACGFSSASSYIQSFRKVYGKPPRASTASRSPRAKDD